MALRTMRPLDHPVPPLRPSRPPPGLQGTDLVAIVVATIYLALAVTLIATGLWHRQAAACFTIGHTLERGCREAR